MHTEHDMRRYRLENLVRPHFGRDFDLVVRVIQEKTGARVSERTIQAWLIPAGRKSSRNCPEWALKALEEYVSDPANRESLQFYAARREATSSKMKAPLEWSDEVRSSRAVEMATSALEDDARDLRRWQEAIGGPVGKMLFELERSLRAEINAHQRTLIAIHEALRTGATYEEFKSQFQDHVRAGELQAFYVRNTKAAIENGTEEFSMPDAVIQPPRSEGA